MKTIAYIFAGAVLCTACGPSSTKTTTEEMTTADSSASAKENDIAGSYTYQQDGDTVALHLTIQGTKAMGHLTYAWKEKDHNSGSFEGEVKDGLLIADYTFESEGMSSVREVAFKLNGKTAKEGYGDVEEKEGKFVFKDFNSLNFDSGLVLTKEQ
ncbi:hypothetical protein [Sphingobacterium deserti]|uniref:Uncharacterized protein n=1 Tax=Sphingobacterium deserti TaxID=1229276 RepID=A0A0B8T663_9SPHI|nr:hypothetical protein [Sphingobacterium deserti]KGE13369.1 hypothetical protein DI53_2900 [Sphingobacterium deserti]